MKDLAPLDRDDLADAVAMLTRAYAAYVPMRHYVADQRRWPALAAPFFEAALRYGLRFGQIHVTSPRIEGLAVWLPAAHSPASFWGYLRAGALPSFFRFARAGGRVLRRMGQHVDRLHHRFAPPGHQYLEMVGVDPQEQGRGHAGRLLRPMLAKIDAAGLPCYTDTGDEKNVGLYEYLGFEVVDTSIVPGTGDLRWWAMVRPPR